MFGSLFISLAVYFTINLFINQTGSYLDFDSLDSKIYDDIAKRGSEVLYLIYYWISSTKFQLDDVGGTFLPLISYYIFDTYIFSRILNIFLHIFSTILILKINDNLKSRIFVLFILYNPVLIYLVSSGLKETLMCFILSSSLYLYYKKKHLILQFSIFSFLFFRNLLFVKMLLLNVSTFRKISFLLIGVIIYVAITLDFSLDTPDSRYLIYSYNNPDFITDKVPLQANIGFLTGPFPLISNLNSIFNQYWLPGLLFFNMITLNYWITFFSRKKNVVDLIIVLSIIILIISGTTWKLRYWIPIFYFIIYQYQTLQIKFLNKTYFFYFMLLIVSNYSYE